MKELYSYITITQDNIIELKSQHKPIFELSTLQEEVKGFIEVVIPSLLENTIYQDVRIVCDDEGMYKAYKPNILASALYAGYSPILGNVLICKQGIDPDTGEHDIMPFSMLEGQKLYAFIIGLRDHIQKEKPEWQEYKWFD